MIIIIEGIDRVGKTTLVNKLKEELNLPVFKHNPDAGVNYADMSNIEETDKMLQMVQILRMTNGSIIFDRFHISDYVYGCLERNYQQGKAYSNLYKIERALLNYSSECGPVIEILVEPTDVSRSSAEHGKNLLMHEYDMEFTFDNDILMGNKKKKIVCNYETLDEAVEKVKEIIGG